MNMEIEIEIESNDLYEIRNGVFATELIEFGQVICLYEDVSEHIKDPVIPIYEPDDNYKKLTFKAFISARNSVCNSNTRVVSFNDTLYLVATKDIKANDELLACKYQEYYLREFAAKYPKNTEVVIAMAFINVIRSLNLDTNATKYDNNDDNSEDFEASFTYADYEDDDEEYDEKLYELKVEVNNEEYKITSEIKDQLPIDNTDTVYHHDVITIIDELETFRFACPGTVFICNDDITYTFYIDPMMF
jgi:hypothetical protein